MTGTAKVLGSNMPEQDLFFLNGKYSVSKFVGLRKSYGRQTKVETRKLP